MEEQNNFDQRFREAGEHFAPPLPPHAWKHIADAMDARAGKKRVFLWASTAAAACLLIGLGLGYFFGRTGSPPVDSPFAVQPRIESPLQLNTESTSQPEPSVPAHSYSNDLDPVAAQDASLPTKQGAVQVVTVQVKEETLAVRVKKLNYNQHFAWRQLAINRQVGHILEPNQQITEEVEFESYASEESPWQWSAAAMGSPLLAFQDARANNAVAQRNLDKEELGGYSLGMGVRVQSANRWEYQVGFNLTALNKVTNNPWMELSPMGVANGTNSSGSFELDQLNGASTSTTAGGFDILAVENTSFAGTYVQVEAQLNQQVNYLDIPLGVGYYLVQNRFGLMANLGVTPRVIVQQSLALSGTNGQEVAGNPTANSRLGLLGWAGFTASYSFSKQLSWEILPQIGYGLVPQIATGEVVNREHQIAVFTGLRYRF